MPAPILAPKIREKCQYQMNVIINLTSSPTLILFKLHLISNLSEGGVLSGIHWNCATQAMTPKYSTLGLAMSLGSRTPGIPIFLPPKTAIEFQLVLWIRNQRNGMSEA